jgi:hypothetical protein
VSAKPTAGDVLRVLTNYMADRGLELIDRQTGLVVYSGDVKEVAAGVAALVEAAQGIIDCIDQGWLARRNDNLGVVGMQYRDALRSDLDVLRKQLAPFKAPPTQRQREVLELLASGEWELGHSWTSFGGAPWWMQRGGRGGEWKQVHSATANGLHRRGYIKGDPWKPATDTKYHITPAGLAAIGRES